MTPFDIEYAVDQQPLEELLQSVNRPGDFCTHGRMFVPMPRLEVEGVGMLSFPVPDSQVRALVEDPIAQVGRFPLRKELRAHLHRQIDRNKLDMSHVTERRGGAVATLAGRDRRSGVTPAHVPGGVRQFVVPMCRPMSIGPYRVNPGYRGV